MRYILRLYVVATSFCDTEVLQLFVFHVTEALTCCQVFVDVTVKKCGMPSSGSTVHIVINGFDSYVKKNLVQLTIW